MTSPEPKLTRKERRKQRQQGHGEEQIQSKLNFNLKHVEPLTENQRKTFESYQNGKNLLLHGIAGTGKSFLSIYLSLNEIMGGSERYKKLYIVRSVVPTREMGFLPGSAKEKAKVYEAPYYSICTELFNRGDSYEYLKQKQVIEFISTSFIRGITLNDCIIVVDEMQNMDYDELASVITRTGKNCKIIFSGDFRQSDFRGKHSEYKNDVKKFMSVIQNMPKDFEFVEFGIDDIVRSKLVKNFIIAADRLGV